MFPIKVVFLACFYIILVSSESLPDAGNKFLYGDWRKEDPKDINEPKFQLIHWSDFNKLSTRKTYDFDLTDLKYNYTASDNFDGQSEDNNYSVDTSYDTSYSVYLPVVAFFKLIMFIVYRVCRRKNAVVVVPTRTFLIPVDPEENNLNEQTKNDTEQAQNNSEDKPPSYEDSVVTNPLPRYEELMETTNFD